MLNKLLKTKFHLRFIFPPLIRYKAEQLNSYSGVTDIKRDTPLIVSLTSYQERFSDLELSLYSLLNQTLKPDRIILWLSDEIKSLNDLPYEITKFIKNGLEIRFVGDLRSYTKCFYTFKEYRNSIIVTADDDVYYPKDWLNKLYYSYISHPEDIHVHRAHRVIYDGNNIIPYENWIKHVEDEDARFDNFLTGVGGVLYPPKCFSSEVLRKDIFLENSPTADDVWLWVMALVHNRRIRVVQNHIKTLTCTNIFRQIFQHQKTLYQVNKKGFNDIQLNNLMKYYSRNILINLKKS